MPLLKTMTPLTIYPLKQNQHPMPIIVRPYLGNFLNQELAAHNNNLIEGELICYRNLHPRIMKFINS